MKITEIIFSPTGGTEKVSKIISEEISNEIETIDISNIECSNNKKIDSEDLVIIAMPSFNGRIPTIAAERLLKIDGNEAKALLVCVYGNRDYEDSLVEMQDIAENCGFQTIAAISAIAEHSIAHEFANGRPDDIDKSELKNFAKKVKEKFLSCPKLKLNLPGNRPYKESGNIGLIPQTTDECINCGKCSVECPTGAISRNDFQNTDSNKCISCMRCTVVCPKKAKKIDDSILDNISLFLKKVCSERKNNELFI